jgi:CelD/BcsL family acetyltransferase involved in cellulose biosynthesis
VLHDDPQELSKVRWADAYVLDLPERPEELRFGNARNHQRIKWSVGKARKAGVEIREASTEADVAAWHRLHAATMQAHAVPPYPLRFFMEAWRRLAPAGLARLLLAERRADAGRTMLAGSLFVMYGTTVYYAYSGMRRDAAILRPNDLIQWNAIHRACEDGFRRYDLGAVLEHDQGLVLFKRKWGAEPLTRYRYYYPRGGRRRFGTPDRTELYREHGGRLRAGGEAVWRRLPLPVTTAIGGYVYRWL